MEGRTVQPGYELTEKIRDELRKEITTGQECGDLVELIPLPYGLCQMYAQITRADSLIRVITMFSLLIRADDDHRPC